MDQNSSNDADRCSCRAAADLAIMRKEMERYKALYESEKQQFQEFQWHTEKLENEMKLELEQRNKKLAEFEVKMAELKSNLELFEGLFSDTKRIVGIPNEAIGTDFGPVVVSSSPSSIVAAEIDDITEMVESFDNMSLKENLLRGIYAFGFEKPSAIQQRAVQQQVDEDTNEEIADIRLQQMIQIQMQQIGQQQAIYLRQQQNLQQPMIPCEICHQLFKNRHGMAIHKGQMHRPPAAASANARQKQKRRMVPEMQNSAAVAASRQKNRRMMPMVVKTENQVHSERRPPKSKDTMPSSNFAESSNRIFPIENNNGLTDNNNNASTSTNPTNAQFVDEGGNGNDLPSTSNNIITPILPIPDIEYLETIENKAVGRGLIENIDVERSIGSLVKACARAQSTLILENVRTKHVTIDRITVRFE